MQRIWVAKRPNCGCEEWDDQTAGQKPEVTEACLETTMPSIICWAPLGIVGSRLFALHQHEAGRVLPADLQQDPFLGISRSHRLLEVFQ